LELSMSKTLRHIILPLSLTSFQVLLSTRR
jgi:hypothetical protein